MPYLLTLLAAIALFLALWRLAAHRNAPGEARRTADDPLANTPVSFLRVDGQGQIVSVQGGWERVLGWPAVDTIGKPYLGFIAAEDRARTRALEDRLRESSLAEFSGTVRLARRSGATISADVRVYPQRDNAGRVTGAILVVAPGSEMRRGRVYHDEGIATGQAPNSSQSVDRGDALGRTLAGLAHELNNPLAAITGFAQILLRSTQTSEDRHAIETILNEARRATRLIRDVITVARGEAVTAPERTDVNALVLSSIAQLRPDFDKRGIAVTTELYEGELVAKGVPEQLGRVINNLLRNAQRHLSNAGNGRAELRVRTDRLPEGVLLEIADNGPALSADALAHVWDPFAITGDDADSSGFELAVARSLALAQNARISARPLPQGGTAFAVLLPVFNEPGIRPVPNTSRPTPLDVLIVDDEAAIRDLLSRFLEIRGHAVVMASSGEQALRLAGQNSFDVVISDVRMPGIDGAELVRRLKGFPTCASTRFVLSTGDSLLGTDDLGIGDVSGVRMLHKPFDVAGLTQVVEAQEQGD